MPRVFVSAERRQFLDMNTGSYIIYIGSNANAEGLMPMSDSREDWQPGTMPALLIAIAARLLARLADARFRDLGISMSQLPVLVALKDGASLSQRELTRLAGVEQPSMAQLLARMERDGVIRRKPDPTDGRSSLISLTARTMKLIDPARAIMAQGNREALAGFNEDEIKQLVAMLHRVIANVSDGSGCRPTSGAGVAPPGSNSTTDSR